MQKNQYVTYGGCGCGCGVESPINGCRFTLAPMCDDFVDVILSAVAKTDQTKVWIKTDKLSTVCRGRQCHVEDVVKACFIHAYRAGTHMTMEATYSRGCPGDTEADCFLAQEDAPANEEAIKDAHFPVVCKISLYPMGVGNYMEYIAHVVNHAIDLGIYAGSSHYCTMLACDVQALFAYIHDVNSYCGEHLSHYVFEVTVSVNSPTA